LVEVLGGSRHLSLPLLGPGEGLGFFMQVQRVQACGELAALEGGCR
jgi:hypothetical protein